MTAPVIDLAEIRAARDAAVLLGREVARDRVVFIVNRIGTWADRAYAGSGAVFVNDPDMAGAINRWALRRLRGEVRRALSHHLPPAGMADVLGTVEDGFWGQIGSLHHEATKADKAGQIGGEK